MRGFPPGKANKDPTRLLATTYNNDCMTCAPPCHPKLVSYGSHHSILPELNPKNSFHNNIPDNSSRQEVSGTPIVVNISSTKHPGIVAFHSHAPVLNS